MNIEFVGMLDETYTSDKGNSAGTRFLTFKVLVNVNGEDMASKMQLRCPPGVALPAFNPMKAQRVSGVVQPRMYRGDKGSSLSLVAVSLAVKEI